MRLSKAITRPLTLNLENSSRVFVMVLRLYLLTVGPSVMLAVLRNLPTPGPISAVCSQWEQLVFPGLITMGPCVVWYWVTILGVACLLNRFPLQLDKRIRLVLGK